MRRTSGFRFGRWAKRAARISLLAAASLLSTSASRSHEISFPDRMDFVPPAAGTYRLQRIMAAPRGKVLDIDGKEHEFSSYTTGRVTLLSFIYTHCSDAKGCPLAYAVLQSLKKSIESIPGMREKVRFVSLSFDPQNDTPDVMRTYGGNDARTQHGLRWYFLTTRSGKELIPLLDGLGQDVSVVVVRPEGQRAPTLSHLLKVFLIDAHGEVREIYTSSFLLPDVLLNDIKTLLMENTVLAQ
jgi:cytochrome oxidase Cu insertion factor (SCO1/SenC/PrrC family)